VNQAVEGRDPRRRIANLTNGDRSARRSPDVLAGKRAPGWAQRLRVALAAAQNAHAGRLIGAAALLVAIVAAGGIVHAREAGRPVLAGTELGRQQAPDFLLRDASGQAYSLSRFRGKIVVLAFLYTQCPDVCPFTAELLRKADAAAGHPADVEYVAVSVDPFGDNATTIAAFSQEHQLGQLGERFHYLIGSLPELARVWQQYSVRDAAAPELGQPVDHEAWVYVIDKQGLRRRLIAVDVPVAAFVRDLRAFEHR